MQQGNMWADNAVHTNQKFKLEYRTIVTVFHEKWFGLFFFLMKYHDINSNIGVFITMLVVYRTAQKT